MLHLRRSIPGCSLAASAATFSKYTWSGKGFHVPPGQLPRNLTVPQLFGMVDVLAADAPDPNAPEQAKSTVADQIRNQGYACDRAKETHRNKAPSKPDGMVSFRTCV